MGRAPGPDRAGDAARARGAGRRDDRRHPGDRARLRAAARGRGRRGRPRRASRARCRSSSTSSSRATPGPLPERELYAELGRGEAREGRSLEALLAAYRIGARVAWRRAAARARELELDGETLALLAESIFAYIDELSAASAEGFAREQSAAAGEADRRRAALARLLIQHPPADPAQIELAARDAGTELPDRFAAVVWAPREDDRTASWLPLGSLAVADGELSYALVPDPDAPMRRAEITPRVRAPHRGARPVGAVAGGGAQRAARDRGAPPGRGGTIAARRARAGGGPPDDAAARARPVAAGRAGRAPPGPADRGRAPRRAGGCWRRSRRGSSTTAASPTSRARSTSTRRPCATGSTSCATSSATSSTTPTRASS